MFSDLIHLERDSRAAVFLMMQSRCIFPVEPPIPIQIIHQIFRVTWKINFRQISWKELTNYIDLKFRNILRYVSSRFSFDRTVVFNLFPLLCRSKIKVHGNNNDTGLDWFWSEFNWNSYRWQLHNIYLTLKIMLVLYLIIPLKLNTVSGFVIFAMFLNIW